MSKKELFDVAVEKLHETEKAWLLYNGSDNVWVPKSMAELDRNKDGTYILTSSEWFLKEKGFI